jgi:hypothetical protein
MPEPYNPIVRTFGQLRAALVNTGEITRGEVRPGTPLESLVPVWRRRRVWRELRAKGLRPPPLELSGPEQWRQVLWVLRTALSAAVSLRSVNALLLVVPLAMTTYWVGRYRAVEFPLGLKTVGELTIAMTCFAEHKGSGYRWTHNEIALKVRLIVAESLGLPLEAVRPECTLVELGAD